MSEMKTTTHKCDHCGNKIDYPKEQVWQLVRLRSIDKKSACFCWSCTEHFRILAPTDARGDPLPKPPPTIEDVIRRGRASAIVQEEIDP